jgi:hypothetical protein
VNGYKKRALKTALVLVAASVLGSLPQGISRGGENSGLYTDQLPENPLFCSFAGSQRRLTEALSGRPMVVFLTDIHHRYDNPLGRHLTELQMEYGPWFTWVGVLVGEADAEEVKDLRSTSHLRLEDCFHDSDGDWWREFGLGALPGVVVINEDGYILGRFDSFDSRRAHEITTLLGKTARSGNLKGRALEDFRLPDEESKAYLSLFDVTGRDYTIFYFLQTSCVLCFRELQVLERIRDRYRESVGLVAVFHDTVGGKGITEYLSPVGIEPDFILRDPEFLNRSYYDFQALPVLLVAGPGGKIVFSRKGFRSGDARPLANDLDSLFREDPGAETSTPFQEARRIHGEALEYFDSGRAGLAAVYWERALELFPDASSLHACLADAYGALGRSRDSAREYARYLSAHPLAYDRGSIRSRIRALFDSSP